MKKNSFKIIVITLLLLIVAFYSLQHLREKRLWPFNSGLASILPPSFKKFAYRITAPSSDVIYPSFLYSLNASYFNIPDKDAVGGGGSINVLTDNLLLITLNNGKSLVFNLETKKFEPIYTKDIDAFFSSVRDVIVFNKDGKSYLAYLGTINSSGGCKKLALRYANFSQLNSALLVDAPKLLWESETGCIEAADSSSGARIIYKDDRFLISTGFMVGTSDFEAALTNPQDPKSSFGKILEIDWTGKSNSISIGHRNPQGLFYSPTRNLIFSTEHSIRGGDELNLIKKGGNYGFPCETYGTSYSYNFDKPQLHIKRINSEKYCLGKKFEEPIFYWADKTGISQGIEYYGKEFTAINGDFLIGSLSGTSIFRIQLGQFNNVMFIERINIYERIRDLTIAKDGKIIVLSDGGDIIILSALKISP
jgi:hypothetical protein